MQTSRKPLGSKADPPKNGGGTDMARMSKEVGRLRKMLVIKDRKLADVQVQLDRARDSAPAPGSEAVPAEILEVSEREQQRIGQDLHDDLGQQLVGAWCICQVLVKSLKAQESPDAQNVTRIAKTLSKALVLTRRLAKGLHPVALDAGGLMAAFHDLATRTTENSGVPCRFTWDVPVDVLDNTTATHLYRIGQEAVANAVKHGQPRSIEIKLSSTRSTIALSISDDGRGLPKGASHQEGLGLSVMRYRANAIDGKIAISRARKGGTIVKCTLQHP